MEKINSLVLIIFGITSNLAQIKLIPALYDMEENGNMPAKLTIIGNSRKPISKQELDEYVTNVLASDNKHHKHPIKKDILQKLLSRMHHVAGNLDDPQLYLKLNNFILETDETLKTEDKQSLRSNDLKQSLRLRLKQSLTQRKGPLTSHELEDNRIYYLATYPELYHHVFENLQKNGMNKQEKGFVRLMIEKPIGSNLESATELNKLVLKYFDESQVYRLDHYLGKETLQNILTFRFGNSVFEPVINHEYIDHIQITASEDFGIGKRGGYFDTVGSLKDVGQNHQLQMIAFATMDAPADLTNEAITKERVKILEKLIPIPEKVVFGQYEGYVNEENVAEDSITDTFYAFKTFIDNSRFKDVPIYVRAGKKLKETVTEIAIVFKKPINKLYSHLEFGDQQNVLIYRIQPNEGIVLKILTKKPGHGMEVESDYMQFHYRENPKAHILLDPYERLISDAIRGDQTFFNDSQEVEAQWKFVDPLVQAKTTPALYKSGTWGPGEADELIQADGREWIQPNTDFKKYSS